MASAIRYSVTYDVVTEESAEHGDFAESGFVVEPTTATFRELVEDIQNRGVYDVSHTMCESSGRISVTHHSDSDYRTGAETTEYTHIDTSVSVARRLLKFLAYLESIT